MLNIGILHYLVVAALLFLIGMVGVITRRNVVIIFMSIELMLSSVNLNLLAFSAFTGCMARSSLFLLPPMPLRKQLSAWEF